MTEFLGTARYQPVRRLGAGGMGIVYEVFDRERGEHVALKTLSRIDPSGIYDLKKEFRSLADVRHPNVVTLYEMVNDDDRWFFTMELVHGSPFTEHVARDALRARPEVSSNGLTITETRIDPRQGRPFDELRLRAALAQLVLGVSAIHAAGRLHRDLKPSNVLVTGEGRVVVLDFGLVQDDGRSEPADTSLDDHWLVGTPAYMAPEQAAGHRATKATDWYAVGAMLYRALTGQLPFDGSVNEVLLRKQAEEPRAPSSLVDGLPRDLEQLALHLIQRSVDARADEAAVRRHLALDSAPARITLPPHERLVGREVELGWLQQALDQSRRGVPQVLFLEGPSGFGKTALAQDFSREVRRDPSAVVLSGRCYPREALPYRAFDAVIDALSRYLSRLPEARAHELLPRNCRALTSLFPVLERVSAIQNQRSLALPPATLAEQRERAFGALKELLARISDQGPLLLVIENLEWGDEDSAELLARICSDPDPPALLLIGTHHPRAESEGAFFARLGARSPSLGAAVREHRSIGPLAPEHAFQLCKEKLHCPDRVAWRLAEETAGDPLLISLLCEHLREHPEGIPSGSRTPLEALVAFEIGRLDVDTLACLDLITVAGAPVLPDDLGEALGLAQEAVRTCLAQLTDEGLLQLVYHQGRESVSVRHERIAGALIARMTPEELAGHHASWADALLARGHAEPETLADHYQKAGEESLARRYAIQAARRAERALAFDRAVHLYERALALAPKGAEQAEILEWLAETRLHLGQPGNAAAALLEAARLSPPERAAELRKRSAALRLTDEQLDALFSGGGNGEGLFDGITREAVQAFLAKGQLTDAAKGSCVSRRNDRPASVLVVLAGGLRVEQAAGNVELGPGEILGTLSFLHNTPRLADVYATADGTRVLRITRASLEELNQTQPQLALQLTLNLARILCGKLVNVHARAFRLPG